MARFFNPNEPAFDYGYRSTMSGGGGSRAPKPKRDLASEKRDAEAMASKLSEGDPDKYASTLTKLGYAEEAVKYKDTYAKAREQDIKVQELEMNQSIEQERAASDLSRAGREDLALRIINNNINNPEERYSSFKYNPKNGKVNWANNAGETGEHDLNAIIKAGTKSQVQFQEQAAMERVKLQTMKDPKTLSPTDLLGIALTKNIALEGIMKSTGEAAEIVLKKNPHLENSPTEKTLILNANTKELAPMIGAAIQANPQLFKMFGAKTPDDAAKIFADVFIATQTQLRDAAGKAQEPKPGGSPNPKTSKGGESSSVTVTTRDHPAFKDSVLMVSPDGREGQVAAKDVDAASAAGYKKK